MNILNLTNDNFSEIIAANELILIDFWAEWCAPCRAFAKIVDGLASQYPDVLFGKVNIDEEKALALDFQIQSIPAVLVLKSQVVVYAGSGLLSASAVKELLEKARILDVSEAKE